MNSANTQRKFTHMNFTSPTPFSSLITASFSSLLFVFNTGGGGTSYARSLIHSFLFPNTWLQIFSGFVAGGLTWLYANACEFQRNISECHGNISEHDPNITEYHSNISEGESNISEYHPNITEYHPNISEEDSKISEYHPNISECHSNISECHSNISEYDYWLIFSVCIPSRHLALTERVLHLVHGKEEGTQKENGYSPQKE